MAGTSLLALVETWTGSGDVNSAKKLQAALAKAAATPSRDSREAREAALKAFKAVQQRLCAPGLGGDAAEQLAGLGRAALAALAAGSSGSTTSQLAGWRYNFARRLVTVRAYASAHAEARELLRQLNEQAGLPRNAITRGAAATTEAASMAVGAVLTLVLSCVEGRLLGDVKTVDAMLTAAGSLPGWLSQLGADEAARHSEAAYKYLYKAGVALLEQRSWQQLASVCGGLMSAAGGNTAAQRRALTAAAKLVAHMPDEQAATAVAVIAAKACEECSRLEAETAADLLGMLCSVAQRATGASATRVLSEAADSCGRSILPPLQVAPLLLPAMALQLSPADRSPNWLERVSSAVGLVNTSLQQLLAPLPSGTAQQHAVVLQAAYQPSNVLRRALAAQLSGSDKAVAAASHDGDVCKLLGGSAGVSLAASALELLAGAAGVMSRQPHGGMPGILSGQGHAGAVALVTAARLRASCLLQQAGQGALAGRGEMERIATACAWLLGWGLQPSARCEPPPAACAVEPQQLSWVASALFNVGLDLHAARCYAAAVPALQAAAAVGLQALAKGPVPVEDEASRLADFCRKCVVLAGAQQQAGDPAGALGSLGCSVVLLLRMGFAQPAAWLPLVEAFVRLQCDATQQEVAAQGVGAAPQPARRGRGASSKKGAASAAAGDRDAASSSQAAADDILLVHLLQQHEADLPSGSIAAVMEHELHCWGAALQGGSAAPLAAVSAAASRTVKRLLQEVYPLAVQPVQHAGVLLALHQAGLPADDGRCGLALLEAASAALSKVPSREARCLLARVHCWHAVEAGRQHACQVLVEQQQERQRSHAAASTSAVGSSEQDAAALGQLAGSTAVHADAWQRLLEQAELAVETLGAAGNTACAPSEFEELAWLLAVHGREAAVQQLSELLPGSMQPVAGALAGCLFPTASASAAELQQQAEEAAAEASRGSAGLAMQRATVHGQAAEACATAGDVVPALFHAAEAHRLLAVLFHGVGTSAGTASAARPGWWRLTAVYLGSLLQLGQLFEAAGQADEALHSLREGQRLAVAAGSASMAALFAARMADIFCKQGDVPAAEQAAAAAEQQLDTVPESGSLALAYCTAAVQLVRAQLSLAAAGGSPGKAVWQACQTAVAGCEVLVSSAASDAAGAGSFCSALHAAALLTLAEAAIRRDDVAGARRHAAAALAAAETGGTCSAARCQHASALLFLGRHAATGAAAQQHLSIWGLGATGCGSSASCDAEAAAASKSRARKQPAGRGRSKAAAAAAEDVDSCNASAAQQDRMRQLWQALECSRGLLPAHREAAALLAAECGQLGYLHLAALLLHCSLGAALHLQYQLVLFSRQQQLTQRQRRGVSVEDAVGELPAQLRQLDQLSSVLQPAIDWQVVRQLFCTSCLAGASAQRGRRTAAAAAAGGTGAPSSAAALATLEQQAARQLQAWLTSLPADTAACSISTLSGLHGGSILISRLSPAASTAEPPLPPLLVMLPVQQLSASLSQHPIRALQLDDDAADDACGAGVSSVQSVLDEMAAVLVESGRSMRELSTETKEEQREWWRARLALDDRLAALTRHLDSSWLGPWRCLLLGAPHTSDGRVGEAAAQHLAGLLAEAGQPASQQQAGVLRHAAALLARHAGGMSPGDLRQAAHQLCVAAGLACSQEQQQRLEALLAVPPAGSDMGAEAEAAPSKARKGGRSVKFAEDASDEQAQQQQAEEEEEAERPAVLADGSSRTGCARRPTAARARRGPAVTAAAAEQAAESSARGSRDASPIATLAAVGDAVDPPAAAAGGLCQALDALRLADVPAPGTVADATATGPARGGTTARSGKHRSRLRMLQAGTPGPARKSAGAAGGAATAPRPARELPLTAAKTAPPPASRSGRTGDGMATAAAAAAPVLLVLDGALQGLPWESAPGLLRQRLYRMPNLACAAASARRASTSVDLSSTFYALNPSGDLATTQATFQDWFRGMKGWEGKAGCAPTAAELAAALQRHAFFLYCGHGGGEQYISVTKLRSLERCSAALLMGCSSGRLRTQQHYEPAGAVLAYLLAGCPAAVANLWDVTDRDIDRFSQAVLTAYISGGGGGGVGGGSSRSSSRVQAKHCSDDENAEPPGTDMSAAVGASRGACKLPHLVGAAPVCYGLPARAFLGPA